MARVTTTNKMEITAGITQNEIGHYYGIGREKAHKMWIKLLLFCNGDEDYIITKNDFAAYLNKDIREVLFYFYPSHKGVIEIYENYLNDKIANEKKLDIVSEISTPTVPTEMELEVEYMLNKLSIITEGKLKTKKIAR